MHELATGPRLHVCCVCHADMVVPAWFEPVSDAEWHLLLRCGECGTYRDLVVVNAVADAYDRDLWRGMDMIARALATADRDRMASEALTFIRALERDLIDAADFSRRR
jgi:hypothetical protein